MLFRLVLISCCPWLDWVAVAALGAIVGTSELVSRYRDDPESALKTWPARFYIGLNARSGTVSEVMKGVDYMKAFQALPPYCLALMQNVAAEDQQQLRRALETHDQGTAEPRVKAYLLGLELINVVGIDVLTTAVASLGEEIRSTPSS